MDTFRSHRSAYRRWSRLKTRRKVMLRPKLPLLRQSSPSAKGPPYRARLPASATSHFVMAFHMLPLLLSAVIFSVHLRHKSIVAMDLQCPLPNIGTTTSNKVWNFSYFRPQRLWAVPQCVFVSFTTSDIWSRFQDDFFFEKPGAQHRVIIGPSQDPECLSNVKHTWRIST